MADNPPAGVKAASGIFVMYDSVAAAAIQFNHVPGGGTVLCMDGQVSLIRNPDESPLDRTMAETACTFDHRPPRRRGSARVEE